MAVTEQTYEKAKETVAHFFSRHGGTPSDFKPDDFEQARGFVLGWEAGFKKGAASRDLICSRCGFSAPLFGGEHTEGAMKNHFKICPACHSPTF